MMKTLFGRTIYEKRWFLAGWSLAFSVMTVLILMFYPSFSDGGGFDEVAKSLPSQLQGFIGDPDVFKTVSGYIASQVYDVRMSLMLIIMTLVLATGLTVKEEENGDLRTTTMTSLSRTRIVLEKFAAAVCIIIGLNLITSLSIYIGLISLGETSPHQLIWQLFALSCLFGATAFAIPYSIALATGKRSITMVIGLIVAIGSYILSTFARSVDWLKNWDKVSLIHYFNTASVREGSFNGTDALMLLLIGFTLLALAIVAFRSRDIA